MWLRASPIPAAALAASLACGTPADEPIDIPDGAGSVQLVDLLDRAAVASPLLAAAATTDASVVPGRRVWALAASDLATRGPEGTWIVDGCTPAAGEAGAVVACDGHFVLRLAAPVERSTQYRWRLRATAGADCAEVHFEEPRQEVQILPLAGEAAAGEVRQTVLTGFATTTLFATLVPRPGRHCALTLAELALERLELAPAAELALLRRQAPLPGAPGPRGLAQAGYLLPVGGAEAAAPPFDQNFSFRESILAPTPTEIVLPLRLPPDARLSFSYGLHRAARLGEAATFQVAVRAAGGAERLLFEARLEAAPATWHWHEATLDLSPWAGRRLELALRTVGAGDRSVPALWGAAELWQPRRDAGPPDIVLIAVDTLRADRVASYGGRVPTPAIDGLAADGILFWNAVSSSNWTLPSFASLFTGLQPQRHGVLRISDRLPAAAPTLAERLRAAGWTTAAVLFKPTLYLGSDLERGFVRYSNVPLGAVRGDRNVAAATAWLEANRERRFFLFVHFNDPHQPFTQPPEAIGEATRRELDELGLDLPLQIEDAHAACVECRRSPAADRRFKELGRRLYDEEVAYVDRCLGELLGTLRRLDLYRETAIVLASDHGESLWEKHDLYGHGGPGFHDNLIRVPLLLKPPASHASTPGTVVGTPVSLADVPPTLLELAGLRPAVPATAAGRGPDGQSLVPFWRRGAAAADRVVLSHGPEGEAARDRAWKYLRQIQPGGGGPEALFDLARDPTEERDVADLHPAQLERLRSHAMAAASGAGGGTFLLVTGEPAAADTRLTVRWPAPARRLPFPHYGLAILADEPDRQVYRGRARGRVLLLDAFDAAPAAVPLVRIEQAAGARAAAAEPVAVEAPTVALFERLLAQPGAWLLRVPRSHAAGEAAAAGRLNAQQLEALRALGYVE